MDDIKDNTNQFKKGDVVRIVTIGETSAWKNDRDWLVGMTGKITSSCGNIQLHTSKMPKKKKNRVYDEPILIYPVLLEKVERKGKKHE